MYERRSERNSRQYRELNRFVYVYLWEEQLDKKIDDE